MYISVLDHVTNQFLQSNKEVLRLDISWLLFWYSKAVRDFGKSFLRRGDVNFFLKWKIKYVIWLGHSLLVFWCCSSNFMTCWNRDILCFIHSVLGVSRVVAVLSVAGTFSLFSITAAFLLLRNQNLTCYTTFRTILWWLIKMFSYLSK